MKRIFPCLIFLILCQFSTAQTPQTLADLQLVIDSLFSTTKGEFAIAFKDLSKGNAEILLNERESFHAASTMKTPVMIELFKQAAEGKFSLQDSLTIRNEFKSIVSGSPFSLDFNEDSGDNLYARIGDKIEIEELVIDMIINSSNLATNLLIELVDAEKVTESMRDLGARDILVLRGVEDIEAYEAGLNNTTTAFDLALIFQKLAKGEAVNTEASERMINILLQQKHKEIIPALLPPEVKVAHKTGSITGVRHDSGIVHLPDGRKYVLVLLSKDLEDPLKGIRTMATVSKLIFDYMTRP